MTDDIAEIDAIDQDDADASIFGFDDAPVTDNRTRGMPGPQTPLTPELLQQIIEGAILAANQPVTVARIIDLFEEDLAPTKDDVLAALAKIATACEGRGFELKEVASGWRFQVRDNLAPWVNRLWDEKPQKYSRALLETLSLIAYRQPITRGDIEEIRGVAVSSHIIKTLLERDWVKVVGQRDVPGRPSLYATTRQFLDYFNLKSLDELPSLSEIRDLDELTPGLDLNDATLGTVDPDIAAVDISPNTPPSEESDEESDAVESDEVTITQDTDVSDALDFNHVLETAVSKDSVDFPQDDVLPTEEITDRD